MEIADEIRQIEGEGGLGPVIRTAGKVQPIIVTASQGDGRWRKDNALRRRLRFDIDVPWGTARRLGVTHRGEDQKRRESEYDGTRERHSITFDVGEETGRPNGPAHGMPPAE